MQTPFRKAKNPMLWYLAAMLKKSNEISTTYNMMSGYRVCDSYDEARGSFLTAVETAMPDYAVVQMTCGLIPLADLKSAMATYQDKDEVVVESCGENFGDFS